MLVYLKEFFPLQVSELSEHPLQASVTILYGDSKWYNNHWTKEC